MPAASGMPSAYYDIYNNIKAKFEKTGFVGKQKYDRWAGPADQKAHMIAKNYVDKRKRTNKELIDDLKYYYQKTLERESFNHPDYKHIHSKEY